MSRDDYETGETLRTPHIEIGKGSEPYPRKMVPINVSTFETCFSFLIPLREGRDGIGLRSPQFSPYSVYGVVGRVASDGSGVGLGALNLHEPPLSRTLMGFLDESVLEKKLPNAYRILKEAEEESQIEEGEESPFNEE